jgi:UDP-N-acetylmuramyl tripeptide synthase
MDNGPFCVSLPENYEKEPVSVPGCEFSVKNKPAKIDMIGWANNEQNFDTSRQSQIRDYKEKVRGSHKVYNVLYGQLSRAMYRNGDAHILNLMNQIGQFTR